MRALANEARRPRPPRAESRAAPAAWPHPGKSPGDDPATSVVTNTAPYAAYVGYADGQRSGPGPARARHRCGATMATPAPHPSLDNLNRLRQAANVRLELQRARALMWLSYYRGHARHHRAAGYPGGTRTPHLPRQGRGQLVQGGGQRGGRQPGRPGFRFGDGETANDAAWQIWQASAMNANAKWSTDALVQGSAFALVQQDDEQPTGVCITPGMEPSRPPCCTSRGTRRRRIAGYKAYPVGPTWGHDRGPGQHGRAGRPW